MVINDAIERYKDGENFSKFSDNQLKVAQVFNFLLIFMCIFIIIRAQNIIITIAFAIVMLHYVYRSYKLALYVKRKANDTKQ